MEGREGRVKEEKGEREKGMSCKGTGFESGVETSAEVNCASTTIFWPFVGNVSVAMLCADGVV